MTKEPNLKEIERRAYISYHQDGLLDIFAGLYILGFGLGMFMDTIWDSFPIGLSMPAILVATVLPIWIVAKRRITMPRIGYVNFGTRGANKLMAIFIGLAVAGLGATFAFQLLIQGENRLWLDLIFENGMLIVGFGSLAVCSLFGYTMGLRRLYAYGLMALVSLVIGHFVGIFFAYILLALGTTVMVAGVALLIGFVKKYPLKGDKTIVE